MEYVEGMKSREERVLHGEVRPEVAKTTFETEQVEEEAEVFYDRVSYRCRAQLCKP